MSIRRNTVFPRTSTPSRELPGVNTQQLRDLQMGVLPGNSLEGVEVVTNTQLPQRLIYCIK